MSKTQLDEYYNTAYLKCNLSDNFMASWKGVAYPNHVFQFIELPFQILAFYVIIAKTPKCMKNIKLPLLINHLSCALVDLSICSLSTLYLFVPIHGAFGVGLLSWLGIGFQYQMFMLEILGICAICSYTYLFESRSSSLPQNRFRISRRRIKILYYFFVFLPFILIVIFLLNIPQDQEAAKLAALQKFPCPTIEFFNSPVVIAISDEDIVNIKNRFIIPFIGAHIVLNNSFHIFCLIYYLYISPPKTLSVETKRSQKRFLIGMMFQCSIPSLLGFIPVLVVFIAYRTGNHSQELVNIMVDCVGLHGLGESLTILLVHKSYRKAVLEIVWKPNKTTTSFQISQWNSNLVLQ